MSASGHGAQIERCAQLATQRLDGLTVNLADARLSDAEHLADLTQVHPLIVVEADDHLLTLWEVLNGPPEHLEDMLLMSLIGCDLPGMSCNLMFAPDMLTIDIMGTSWEGEVYVDIDTGDQLVSCTIPAGEFAGTCGPDSETLITIEDGALSIQLWNMAPETAEVFVEHDGGSGSVLLEPEYTVDEPNGVGCGERHSATVSTTL